MTERYDHRNGETEPPTEPGWYWFDGTLDDRLQAGLVKVNAPDSAFPTLSVSPQWTEGWMEMNLLSGQWWGPLLPPWEKRP